MDNLQLKRIDIEKYVSIESISTCLVDMEKEVAKSKQMKSFWEILTQNYIFQRLGKLLRVPARGDSFIETIPSLYLEFALHVDKSIVPYCCRKPLWASSLILELRRSWRRCDKNVQDLGVPREDETIFAPGSPFHLCFSHTQYAHSTLSAEQGRQDIVKHEAVEERCTRLF